MQSKLAAAALAAAAIFGITSCVPPAATLSVAQPAVTAVAAPVAKPATPPTGIDYQAIYLKLTGGNVPQRHRVVLTAPTKNRTNTFAVGSWCFLEYGGKVRAISQSEAYINAEYSFPFDPADADCPSGALFKLTLAELESMTAQTKPIDDKFREQLQAYGSLPEFPKPYATVPLPVISLARVMNLAPVANTDKTFVFWSGCDLKDHNPEGYTGKIEKLGATSLGTLALYTNPRPRTGGECPSGTVFILEAAQLDMPLFIYDNGMVFK